MTTNAITLKLRECARYMGLHGTTGNVELIEAAVARIDTLEQALKDIIENSEEHDEWDAVDKLSENYKIAMNALGETND